MVIRADDAGVAAQFCGGDGKIETLLQGGQPKRGRIGNAAADDQSIERLDGIQLFDPSSQAVQPRIHRLSGVGICGRVQRPNVRAAHRQSVFGHRSRQRRSRGIDLDTPPPTAGTRLAVGIQLHMPQAIGRHDNAVFGIPAADTGADRQQQHRPRRIAGRVQFAQQRGRAVEKPTALYASCRKAATPLSIVARMPSKPCRASVGTVTRFPIFPSRTRPPFSPVPRRAVGATGVQRFLSVASFRIGYATIGVRLRA